MTIRRTLLRVLVPLALAGCAISTQQEVEMGTTYAQQINRQLPIVDDPEVNRYINLLGDSIARLTDDRNLDWRFYVVDSKEVNAFAVPGGFVYVNRGLIERTTRMDQLAGVLGHEIGHIVRRHSVKQMQAAQRANTGLTLACILTRVCESGVAGAAVQIGGGALFAKFSRDDEAEADEEAIRNVMRAGIDPRGIPEMFRILLAERNRSGSGSVDSWFATHPLEEDRIAATEAAIGGISSAALAKLTKDTPRYQAFKQRLAGLPVAAGR
jgi:beta-barrel assembly-enhancing protease